VYPVAFQSDYTSERSRLTTFFRGFMIIPVYFVAILWGIAAFFTIIAAWAVISVTGKYPPGLYAFNAKVLRFSTRANAYYYLLTDVYPPFEGEDHPEYPVRLEIGPPLPEYSRAKAFFRLIVGIPVLVMSYLYALLLSVVGIVSWLAIVFTGKQPPGLQDLLVMAESYQAKAGAYFMLLTESYPPITEQAQVEPGAASAQLGGS
jgi:Domain of unknown function (DUF4389)